MADITIKCTHCQQELSLDERYLDMQVGCPSCGNSFVAQQSEEVDYPLAQSEEVDYPPAQSAEVTVKCPHCQQKLSLDEQYLGMEVECPTCGNSFVAQKTPAIPKLALKMPAATGKSFVNKGKEVAQSVAENRYSADVQNNAIAVKNNQDEPDPGYADEQIKQMNKKKFWKSVPWISLAIMGVFFIAALIYYNIRSRNSYYYPYRTWAIWYATAGIVFGTLYFMFQFISYKFRCRGSKRHKKRDLVREYFSIHNTAKTGLHLGTKILSLVEDNIPFINIIPLIIKGIAESKMRRYCRFREPFYDEVQQIDMEFLENLDILPRFGKNMNQLVSPMQTLFSPAFGGVEGLREFCSVVSKEDSIYRYNLEEVTKVYTFEDQLFVYTGIWSYALGKMISETTEAFFFKDITDIKTESTFKIHTKYEPKGCLSILIPWPGKPIEKVYKESECFILTSASGNSVGLNIGFEDAILVTGASYTQRNDNEKIIHAIRKMIEEKKVALNE